MGYRFVPSNQMFRIRVIAVLSVLISLTGWVNPAATTRLPAGSSPGGAAASGAGARPRLVVLVSIDQFRSDYLTRFEDLYLPARTKDGVGGLRWLMEKGAWETNAFHDHLPLFTGPGHSVLLTGAPPYTSGIVGNGWYDRKSRQEVYCVGDPAKPLVGLPAPAAASATGVSALNLRVSTLGDELKMATGGRAKVWGLGFKDRAAVLMAGHLADGVLWFDDESGGWIGSKAWFKNGSLPDWVAAWNVRKPIDAWFGKVWNLSVPAKALDRLWAPGNEDAREPAGFGERFPHRIDGGLSQPGKAFYRAFVTTPFANDYVLDTAREIVRREKMGEDLIPDILAVNLATNDYIGHSFGPDSAEVLDAAVTTDRALSGFFNWLGRTVPGGLASVTIVVTCDHGVAPNAAAMARAGFDAGTYDEDALRDVAEKALDAALGPGDWTAAMIEGALYIDRDELARAKIDPSKAETIAAEAIARQQGVYDAYTRSGLLAGAVPKTDLGARLMRSFHPDLSGDVVVVPDPHWTPSYALKGATHGSPYAYDTKVPLLLAGAGIRPGRYWARSSTLDIAPTLAELIGVLAPSGSEGRILGEALKMESPRATP